MMDNTKQSCGEKPILFSGDMVKAILEGRKTMTRRIVKPLNISYDISGAKPEVRIKYQFLRLPNGHEFGEVKNPYGQIGDRLWVRETFQFIPGSDGGYVYKASQNGKDWEENSEDWTWRPSIFMPREASRIILEIADVRVERLQNITEEDAKAEGIEFQAPYYLGAPHPIKGTKKVFPDAVQAFQSLWDKINGKRASWESNPFVWVISSKVAS